MNSVASPDARPVHGCQVLRWGLARTKEAKYVDYPSPPGSLAHGGRFKQAFFGAGELGGEFAGQAVRHMFSVFAAA